MQQGFSLYLVQQINPFHLIFHFIYSYLGIDECCRLSCCQDSTNLGTKATSSESTTPHPPLTPHDDQLVTLADT